MEKGTNEFDLLMMCSSVGVGFADLFVWSEEKAPFSLGFTRLFGRIRYDYVGTCMTELSTMKPNILCVYASALRETQFLATQIWSIQ